MPERKGNERAHEPGQERRLAVLLVVCVIATLALGVAKLFVQRAHPPVWATGGIHTHEGFISIDQYCERSELFRAWLAGEDPGGAELLEHLRVRGHATAVLVPGLVALLGLVTGSIVFSFALLSGAAFVAQVVLVGRLARRLVPGAPRVAGLVAATLVASHVDSARTAAQLILDPFTAAFATLVVLATLRWLERRDVGSALAMLAAVYGASSVKLASLAVLAAPPLVALVCARGKRKSAVVVGLAAGILPLLTLFAYARFALERPMFSAELVEMWSRNIPTRKSLQNFLVEMALLLQFVPFVLLGRARAIGREALGTLLVAGTFWLSVASIGLHDDARLYLPVLGLAVAGSTPSLLAMVPARWIVGATALFAAGNLAVAAVGLMALRG